MAFTPLAVPSVLPSELLTHVLSRQNYPTTLLICQNRMDFVDSILIRTPAKIVSQPTVAICKSSNSPSSPVENITQYDPPLRNSLLIPTLDQVATSRHIEIVFLPTVSHLRAYLAIIPPLKEPAPLPENSRTNPNKSMPLLFVYGLIQLHHNTSEWSAQGLGNSLAQLVEAGRRSLRKIILLEKLGVEEFDDGRTNTDARDFNGQSVWGIRVPILSGTIKPSRLQGERPELNGRTVEIARILARWFKFSNQIPVDQTPECSANSRHTSS